jgi:hypothetical protein
MVLSGQIRKLGSGFGQGVGRLEHELADLSPVILIDEDLVFGKGDRVHGDAGVGVAAEARGSLMGDGAVAKGGAFCGAGYDADVHDVRVQGTWRRGHVACSQYLMAGRW